mmetsp:Transcript_32231/g.55726  ORF Transcript_32231/g.55726 Transcript_32231/m.55726 type:complete len:572 (-) Transcript_32231:25-1740(-)
MATRRTTMACKMFKDSTPLSVISETCNIPQEEVLTILARKAGVSEDDVKAIIRLKREGKTLQQLSLAFGVSQGNLKEILPEKELPDETVAAILNHAHSGRNALEISRLLKLKKKIVTDVLARAPPNSSKASPVPDVALPQKTLLRRRSVKPLKAKRTKCEESVAYPAISAREKTKQLKLAESYEKKAAELADVDKDVSALDLLRKSIQIKEQFLDCNDASLGSAYVAMGRLSFNGDIEKAEEFSRKALVILRHYPEHPNLVACCKDLGAILYNKDASDEAIVYELEALDLIQKQAEPNELEEADSYLRLAKLFGKRKDYAKAENLFKSCLEIYEDSAEVDRALLAYVYHEFGAIYFEAENFEDALECFKRFSEVVQESEEPLVIDLCSVYLNYGKTFYELKEFAEAEMFLTQCFELLMENGSTVFSFNFASLFEYLGYLNKDSYNLHKAEEFLSRSAKLKAKARVYFKLGEVYNELGESQQAEKAFNQALDSCAKLDYFHPLTRDILWNLGKLSRLSGRNKQAEEYLLKCVEVLKVENCPPLLQTCYRALRDMYLSLGKGGLAETYEAKLN